MTLENIAQECKEDADTRLTDNLGDIKNEKAPQMDGEADLSIRDVLLEDIGAAYAIPSINAFYIFMLFNVVCRNHCYIKR